MLDNYKGLREVLAYHSKSLKGIVGNNYNAILYFEESSGEVVIDELGNYVLDTTTEVKVKARLSQKKDPNLTVNPGIDTIRTYLEGNLICAPELCGGFPNYLRCEMRQDNQWVTGRFTFVNFVPHAFIESISVATAIGQKICGYFERENIAL